MKPHFDEYGSTREEYGELGYRLFRSAEDENELFMMFDWEDMDQAHSFLEDSDLRTVMVEAGVVGEPEINFLEEIESTTPRRTAA